MLFKLTNAKYISKVIKGVPSMVSANRIRWIWREKRDGIATLLLGLGVGTGLLALATEQWSVGGLGVLILMAGLFLACSTD